MQSAFGRPNGADCGPEVPLARIREPKTRCQSSRWRRFTATNYGPLADGPNSIELRARFFARSRCSAAPMRAAACRTFANRYDAIFVAKKSFAAREIVLNRFDSPRAILLIKSVL